MFSKFYLKFLKSDCIYHFLINLEPNVRLDPNQSQNGKYNLILGLFNKISKIFLCVYPNGSAESWKQMPEVYK